VLIDEPAVKTLSQLVVSRAKNCFPVKSIFAKRIVIQGTVLIAWSRKSRNAFVEIQQEKPTAAISISQV
jgi:hypothetical protein